MKLPERYVQEMRELLGPEYPAYEATFNEQARNGLRINNYKLPSEVWGRINPFSLEPVPWIANGYYYGSQENPSRHPYYYAGLYYLQEPSAMTPASRLPVRPGEQVLDLCAAPGGKATELGAKLQGEGLLWANDISNSRAKALLKNLELAGIGNCCVTSEEPRRLARELPEYFDKILVDAPCSGEGMFRREPGMCRYWEERGPEEYVPIQRELLSQAWAMLRPGGMLLYSTCTFSPKENEENILWLLERQPDIQVLPPEGYEGFAPGRLGLQNCVRIFPHRMPGEGHFLALLKKAGEKSQGPGAWGEAGGAEARQEDFSSREKGKKIYGIPGKSESRGRKSVKLCPEAEAFLGEIRRDFPGERLMERQDRLYLLPREELPQGLRYLRTGLYLGDTARGRFEPSQALAMNLRGEEYPRRISLGLSDPRVVRYLKGETLEAADLAGEKAKGWYLVCVEGYPLGWGKLSGGRLKNKYCVGWRMQ